ncbi:nuclear transport factor 2 family protein [Guyparkeria halophila]|uniref:Nuclear transport factor 2 family protein n=1 Tax=Guyparkeria halophila TaxID=47960 RepID=A0ABZ0YZM8_9GAMM|nr:nuclear transport factor 2 family protein [Guyparkeria halophila]WQH16789.1 nuclear transport factor 2 family protein [Guyparkeria halophila]
MSVPGRGLNNAAALERYVGVMENLRADHLGALETVYANGARFVDPFNEVRGIEAIQAVFAHGFAQCPGMRFLVQARAVDGDCALLRWRMQCDTSSPGLSIEGMSELKLGGDGRVVEHVDYWDPARQLYERVPVLGWLMRRIRARLAAPDSPSR